MLQKKEYQQKIPTTPTKTNVTKEGIPTTAIKKPIIENQTSVKPKQMLQKKEYQQQQRYQQQQKNKW